MNRFELVIFDCDGVLVDSEPVSNRVFGQMLADLGLVLNEEQLFRHFVGYSTEHCMRVVQDMLGRAPPEPFYRDLQRRTFDAFRAELKPVPGIVQALERIDVPVCVASSGDHEKMRTTLGITGLLPRFAGRLFSVTQVAHAKPAPDVYLFAAQQLGADPARCVVVEDTPPGVQAGAAAGMTVLGYCGYTPAERLTAAGAHLTFPDMHSLPELVAQLGSSTRLLTPA